LARLVEAGIISQVAGGRCPSTGQNRGGERRERGRGIKAEIQINFLKISSRNLKNFEHESCREFENLQLF
jgi:hypothetical protein